MPAWSPAVFTVLRTPEREPYYQWVGPVMEVETALYSSNAARQLKQRWEIDHPSR
ncbi:hypothetical protein [Pseudomonas sp. R5(2019)]|uniref:hypothetical protein n=1 Tax=Pseudomonas sp. R5(2019) TaxID=2697566 RepID=UPI002114CCEF|nr:hypothetical protein [Pseudomonas sp. R5(2019)]